MLHTIESRALRVSINDIGAELSHITCRKTQTEYMWQGAPPFWTRRAPVLFPIVGRLKNGVYFHEDQAYEMGIHGFAQDATFAVANKNDHSITFELTHSPQTLAIYPFEFNLRVKFTIEGGRLDVEYKVANPSASSDLIFGIGGHEGFRCPFLPGTVFEDYYLEFDGNEPLHSSYVSGEGLLMAKTYPIHLENNRLPLNYGLFEPDAIVLVDTPHKKVSLKCTKSPLQIDMTFDAPHLAIWTQQNAPFLCLEVWNGLPDFEHTSGNFEAKTGNNTLPPGQERIFRHSISV